MVLSSCIKPRKSIMYKKYVSLKGEQQMASIRDVAKQAGVAVATVSRYMNGTAKVAPRTQAKIEQAMITLDYVPNELARSMFKKKSNTIAMLVPNIQHPWFSSLAAEIEKDLYLQGYKLLLFSTKDDQKREKECLKILRTNIVDGIICGTSQCSEKDYLGVEKPIIMLDYKISDKIPLIVSDHEQGEICCIGTDRQWMQKCYSYQWAEKNKGYLFFQKPFGFGSDPW